ncbi:MAG: aminoacyl-tRNA hydrolase [Chloroflexi bacterium RBG_13_66_10]|nr:MAG: aminoacyl-tRNA hydrolase [Chloroflexi bacterium RBG_13_66_10]
MVVELLAKELGLQFTRRQSKAQVASGRLGGRKVILVKPQTFMNLAGESVASLARFHRVALTDLIVVCDELDLPLGTIRLRPVGGSAGHNGLRSIFEHLGSQDFPRLRIGIGRPPGRMDPADYVLQDFGDAEREILSEALDRAAHSVRAFAVEGIEAAMTRYNGAPPE